MFGPIMVAWFLTLAALGLNSIIGHPEVLKAVAPWYAVQFLASNHLVGLATAATIIASQAVITGAFSLARQAVQLGFMPRLQVQQTSEYPHGQIYMPGINWFLMIAAIALVLTFRSSNNLAAAYGVSVNATMLVTTILAFNVARERGGWSCLRQS
ncbi:KUP/HAK/KT family potassium transporter [Marinobacter sp.]|uniref:KUP/HAK/KT family potassium transporter n=1 Tax=Marinobacter sp. TaxID=50741 RepID=UPI003A8FC7AB